MGNPNQLIQLIYVSVAAVPLDGLAIRTILAQSRQHNPALGITGVLVSCEQQFFQVLEGPRQAVVGLYTRIGEDPRHHQLATVFEEELAERQFGDWSMAHVELSRRSLLETLAEHDTAALPGSFTRPGAALAHALVQAFLQQVRNDVRRAAADAAVWAGELP